MNFVCPTLAVLLAASAAIAAPPVDRTAAENRNREICEATACQRDVRIQLQKPGGEKFDQTYAYLPGVVQGTGFHVFAGQTVLVEADLVDGQLVHLRAVETIKAPEKTIKATFAQVEGVGMMLTLHSPFAQTVKFHMATHGLDDVDPLLKTSSCPVGKNSTIFESWPQPLLEVFVTEGRIPASEADSVCIY